ncbi:MAG: hypothetical protein HY313_02020 [Acidobacteria bacterium]|nr:hypothetical protein [Acidobacteriota bacterium]
MKMKNITILGFTLISMAVAVAIAADSEMDRATLKGLKGLKVMVAQEELEVGQAGLTKSSIQTDVELKLRLAGFPVLSGDADPFLHVGAYVLTDSSGLFRYTLTVQVYQLAQLSRDPKISSVVPTWEVWRFGGIGDVHQVRSEIKDLVDKFINAYLSVNPK